MRSKKDKEKRKITQQGMADPNNGSVGSGLEAIQQQKLLSVLLSQLTQGAALKGGNNMSVQGGGSMFQQQVGGEASRGEPAWSRMVILREISGQLELVILREILLVENNFSGEMVERTIRAMRGTEC